MHRIVILLSVFLIAIAGMLFLQGSNTRDPRQLANLAGEDIAINDVSALNAPATQPIPTTQGTGERALAAAVSAASTPVAAPPPAPAPAPVAAAAPTGDVTMRALTDGVLAELGIAPAAGAQDPQMATATAAVLDGLRGGPAAPANTGTAALVGIVSQALQQGQSDEYIDQLVNEAVAEGRASAPGALRTSDGKVDTAILLSELVRAATGEDPAAPQNGAVGGAGVEVRTVQRAGETVQYQFYTVQPGDSLGAIARRFYGDASLYPQIFDANRRMLSSPDKIRVGQRLNIPTNSA